MTVLRDLWDEAQREAPLFDSGRRVVPPILWSVVVALVWLSDQRWHPELPGAVASGGLAALGVLLVTLLAVRQHAAGRTETRAVVALLGAVGVAGMVIEGRLGAGSFGVACAAMALVLSSTLGRFGIGLAAALGAALLVLAVDFYHVAPLALLLAGAGMVWMYTGPMLGRMNRRVMLQEAAAEERARLAREIHDVLAHTLSALSVQMEGARMLLQERPGDPRALAAVERAQRLVAAGMAETQQAVAALRGDVLPAQDALHRLAEDFARESGVPCRLEVEGTPLPVGPDASLAIYRAAQEALTNVRKHADATAVSILLRYQDGRAELTVADVGTSKRALASSGYGLTGIRERTELLGGELEAGPTADGFRVRLSVPA
ncbi:MAG TPA: histidine kinase [Candidatus Dormibacteraeota bacterium]|nr:histidine kinase [Candidatus Dormibacteraeota bacterium]